MTRKTQTGAASLAITLILLFGMTLVAFYAGRVMIFEQKTSANQYRSTQAFEAADAGLEWAVVMLNETRSTDASCIVDGGSATFRNRYVPATLAGSAIVLTPVATPMVAGCSIDATGALTCSCPASGSVSAASLLADAPTFTVEFATVAGDNESIEVTSRGCTSAGSQCVANAPSGADAFAVARLVVKMRRVVRAMPAVPLSAGQWAAVCGAFQISNTDRATNGNLVDAGGAVLIGQSTYQAGTLPIGAPHCSGNGQTLQTLDGSPSADSIVAADSTLSGASASPDAMFSTLFGTRLAQYEAAATTHVISGPNGLANAATLVDAYVRHGKRAFWVDGPLQFSGSVTLGTDASPVIVAASGEIAFNGSSTIRGLIYADSARWNDDGAGSTVVVGAVVSRASFYNNGSGSITYDPNVLARLNKEIGVATKVPGSWRDN